MKGFKHHSHPRRARSQGLHETEGVSSSSSPLLAKSPSVASARLSSRDHAAVTEIQWNPPKSIKREEPSTYSPTGVKRENVLLPLKTRRLLPPSRRLDAGDDELLAMEAPPNVQRKSTRIQSLFEDKDVNTTSILQQPSQERPTRQASKESMVTNMAGKAHVSVPAESTSLSRTPTLQSWEESHDTFHDMIDTGTVATATSMNSGNRFLKRVESIRSVASRSMASHSTSAELDFYNTRRAYPDDPNYALYHYNQNHHNFPSSPMYGNTRTPPPWITSDSSSQDESSPPTTATHLLVSSSVHHRRRVMLAKSVGMLRSHRPTWDRAESARSFCSQTSSSVAAWSLGSRSVSVGGLSRATSSSSLYSYNYNSNSNSNNSNLNYHGSLSGSLSPPLHVRASSAGTTGKPRKIVTQPVESCTHRPVPATTTTATTTTSNNNNDNDNINNNTIIRITQTPHSTPCNASPSTVVVGVPHNPSPSTRVSSSTTPITSSNLSTTTTKMAPTATVLDKIAGIPSPRDDPSSMSSGLPHRQPNLLLDDDDDDDAKNMIDHEGTLWLAATQSKFSNHVIGATSWTTPTATSNVVHRYETMDEVESIRMSLMGLWQPQPGGSFSAYHRSH